MPFIYILNVPLGNLQTLTNNVVTIDPDAGFVWRALGNGVQNSTSGLFRISDAAGFPYSSDFINSSILVQDYSGGIPYPVIPEVEFLPSGSILVDLQNPFNLSFTMSLIFIGAKRYCFPSLATQPKKLGVVPRANDEYLDVEGWYTYNYDNPSGMGESLGCTVTIDSASDFCMRTISITSYATIDGIIPPGFLIRVSTSDGYYTSSTYIDATVFQQGNSNAPFTLYPQLILRAGSRIIIDINNTTGMTNAQILFRGVRRYRQSSGVK